MDINKKRNRKMKEEKKTIKVILIGNLEVGEFIPLEAIRNAEMMACSVSKTNLDDTSVDLEFLNICDQDAKDLLEDDCWRLTNMCHECLGNIERECVKKLMGFLQEEDSKKMISRAAEENGKKLSEEELNEVYERIVRNNFRPRAGILWYASKTAPEAFKKFLMKRFNCNISENSIFVAFEGRKTAVPLDELAWGSRRTATKEEINGNG